MLIVHWLNLMRCNQDLERGAKEVPQLTWGILSNALSTVTNTRGSHTNTGDKRHGHGHASR